MFDTDTTGIGRAVWRGAIIASVVVAAFVGAVGLWVGAGIGGSLGMGVFAAFWGGPGFGGMLGAVIHVSRKSRVVSEIVAVDQYETVEKTSKQDSRQPLTCRRTRVSSRRRRDNEECTWLVEGPSGPTRR